MKRLIALGLLVSPIPVQAQIEGMIDLHVHSAPDSRPRSINAIEAARLGQRHGMRAMLFKNHYTQTATLAYLVSEVVPGIEIYGGIALNSAVGGVNPVAVQFMVDAAPGFGRIVWMPTFDSEFMHLTVNPNPNNVPVSRNGELLPAVHQVLDLIAAHGLVLATGHSSPEESLMLIRAARDRGVGRIIVTHPTSQYVRMPVETQLEAARLGAYLEYPLNVAHESDEAFAEFAAQIREVDPENVVLTTDLGQSGNPVHTDGLIVYIPRLMATGISQAEIDVMTKRNPARVLGLE
ncbi:MAG TPA: DUF6282 family protein [Gammaproteobacteria bacterium]